MKTFFIAVISSIIILQSSAQTPVRTDVTNLIKNITTLKLDIRNTAGLIREAIRRGLTD